MRRLLPRRVGEDRSMNPDSPLPRCDSCGEPYEPHLGRDGLCFACATHFGCACADTVEPPSERSTPEADSS